MRKLDKNFVLTSLNLKVENTKETPREILELYRPIESIPISGGWGHTKEDCVIINKNDKSVDQSIPFDGIAIEYIFVEERIFVELIIAREQDQRYRNLKWDRLEQNLVMDNGKVYDHLRYSIKCLIFKDWEYLNKKFLENNEFKDNPVGLENHIKEKEDLLYYYETDYWFDITSFFYNKDSLKKQIKETPKLLLYKEHHQNGVKKTQGSYKGEFKDAIKEGIWTFWHENGQMKEESFYINGMKDGKSTLWHENGQMKEESLYKNNRKDGKSTLWYENGQIKKQSQCDGYLDYGVIREWSEKGQLLHERIPMSERLLRDAPQPSEEYAKDIINQWDKYINNRRWHEKSNWVKGDSQEDVWRDEIQTDGGTTIGSFPYGKPTIFKRGYGHLNKKLKPTYKNSPHHNDSLEFSNAALTDDEKKLGRSFWEDIHGPEYFDDEQ